MVVAGCDDGSNDNDCSSDSDCSGVTSACDQDTGDCVECTEDDHCSGDLGLCNAAIHHCVACVENGDCEDDLICVPSEGECVECVSNTDCSDLIFCNGIEVCEEGACQSADPIDCDDGLDCTVDECDELSNGCTYTPDHALCDNDDICDGVERCVPSDSDADEEGCLAGSPVRCDDGDSCTDDFCEEGECRARVRDSDGDGHGDQICRICPTEDPADCFRGDDCDDSDPDVYPSADEICDDGRDNNCDNERDYADASCSIPNDRCGDTTTLEDGATVFASTRGANDSIESACGEGNAHDVVFSFDLSEESDIEIEIDAARSITLTAVIMETCGDLLTERTCFEGQEFNVEARGLLPGSYALVVTSEDEVDFEITLDAGEAVPRPEGDLCSSAATLATDGTVTTVSTTGADSDYTLSCVEDGTEMLDLVYEFTIDGEMNIDLSLALPSGTGPVALSLQETCGVAATELICLTNDTSVAQRYWGLAAGTYTMLIAHDDEAELEVSLDAVDPSVGVYLSEQFDAAPSDWTVGGEVWEQGVPTADSEPDPIEEGCMGTNIGGLYPVEMTFDAEYVETPDIDLSSATAPVLEFLSWMRSEDRYDGGHIEISVDGGAFEVLDNATLSLAYDNTISEEAAWSGSFEAWQTIRVSLTDYVDSTIRLRFAFTSDEFPSPSGNYSGWYIDAVNVFED